MTLPILDSAGRPVVPPPPPHTHTRPRAWQSLREAARWTHPHPSEHILIRVYLIRVSLSESALSESSVSESAMSFLVEWMMREGCA